MSGAAQVVGAITASTLTTVCVFLPIVFVEGITKQLFTDLALTMTYSLLASLIVALTLVPAMASGMLKKEKAVKTGLLERVYPAYRRAVGWSLGHKAVVLLLAVVLLAGSAWGAVSRGFVFMPQIDMNNVSLTVTMPEGISPGGGGGTGGRGGAPGRYGGKCGCRGCHDVLRQRHGYEQHDGRLRRCL